MSDLDPFDIYVPPSPNHRAHIYERSGSYSLLVPEAAIPEPYRDKLFGVAVAGRRKLEVRNHNPPEVGPENRAPWIARQLELLRARNLNPDHIFKNRPLRVTLQPLQAYPYLMLKMVQIMGPAR